MTEMLRIIHLSDTHGCHRSLKSMPEGDILLHSGDFTNSGTDGELADFNNWLGELRRIYKHIIVIPGNHDWGQANNHYSRGEVPAKEMYDGTYLKKRLTNCTMLFHEGIVVEGLNIFGSGWDCWQSAGNPDSHPSNYVTDQLGVKAFNTRYSLIPPNSDVVLTHCPPRNILDCVEGSDSPWGSSQLLVEELVKKAPKVLLFGHLHEQRGYFQKNPSDGSFSGGVEYVVPPKNWVPKTKPVSKKIPCQVLSNNAMLNHGRMDKSSSYLAGSPRVITAQRVSGGGWNFGVQTYPVAK
eukprot:TRINITY_DN401_c0_g1_i2.p1 TRINITY_DN401_c0_g1~~TRINITY_DN401_c0_g1_i2.p1  ORF type:complete len:295 (+),score=52.82 TRINITY_DN401_c0_g1_i2:42-926(+)